MDVVKEYSCTEVLSDKLIIQEINEALSFEVKSNGDNDEYSIFLNKESVEIVINQLSEWLSKQ